MRKQFLSTALLVVVLIVLLLLTIQSAMASYQLSDTIMSWFGIKNSKASEFRALAHIPLYLIICLVLLWFGKTHGIKSWYMISTGVILGVSEEVAKHFVPTRDFDLIDIVMDMIGVCLAALIMLLVTYIKRNTSSQ